MTGEEASISAGRLLTRLELENPWGQAFLWAAMATAAASQGRRPDAAEYLRLAHSHAAQAFPDYFTAYPVIATAAVAQAADRPEELIAALRPVLDGPPNPMCRLWEVWITALEVEALIAANDLDRAQVRLADLDQLAEATPCLRLQALWLRGCLAEAH